MRSNRRDHAERAVRGLSATVAALPRPLLLDPHAVGVPAQAIRERCQISDSHRGVVVYSTSPQHTTSPAAVTAQERYSPALIAT